MKKVKIVKGYFSAAAAKKEELRQHTLAKKSGCTDVKTTCEDACAKFRNNAWFRSKMSKFGKPESGQFIVTVYYVENIEKLSEKIGSSNKIRMKEMVTKVSVVRPDQIISQAAAKAKSTLINEVLKNNTLMINRTRTTHCVFLYGIRFAA